MSSPRSKFVRCTRTNGAGEAISCLLCKGCYHRSCVKMSKKDNKEEWKTWTCSNCKGKRVKLNASLRSNTPTLSPEENFDQNVTMNSSYTSSSVLQKAIRNEIEPLFLSLQNKLVNQISEKNKEVLDQLSQITNSMIFIEQQYEDIKKELSVKTNKISNLEEENLTLKKTVKDLNSRVAQLEQHSRSSNVEVQCIPEHRTENIESTVKQLANTIKFNISEQDLCTRISKVNKESNRPRSVLVKFASLRIRNGFLAAAKAFNKKASKDGDKLNTSHLGIGGDKKSVFIVEHLSPSTKALHAAARTKAKDLGYKFVWVKDGNVFMRKSINSEYYVYVKNTDVLAALK